MNDTFFTEFIMLAGVVGAILAFLIIRRWREEWNFIFYILISKISSFETPFQTPIIPSASAGSTFVIF